MTIPNHCIIEAERIYRESLGRSFNKTVMAIAEALAKAERSSVERAERAEAALNVAVSRGCDHCADSIKQARKVAAEIHALKGGDWHG